MLWNTIAFALTFVVPFDVKYYCSGFDFVVPFAV